MANTLLLQKIGRRYAKAWLETGSEAAAGHSDAQADIQNLKALVEKAPQLVTFFDNPLVSVEEKQQLLRDKFANAVSPLSLNILNLMAESNRLGALAYVISAFEELSEKQDGIAQAEFIVPTAVPQNIIDKLREQLKKQFNFNDVQIQVTEDASILAGAILKINGQQIDGSYRSKLKQLQTTH